MVAPVGSCCAIILRQQRQVTNQYWHHCDSTPDQSTARTTARKANSATSKCTIVENGRVVVKPLSKLEPPEE